MSMLTGRGARIIFAVPFIIFGVMHILAGPKMAGYVPAWLPLKTLWVYVTGVALAAAGVAFILGIKARLAAYLLAVLLLVFMLTVHAPGLPKAASMVAFFKDLALIGGCLMVAGQVGD